MFHAGHNFVLFFKNYFTNQTVFFDQARREQWTPDLQAYFWPLSINISLAEPCIKETIFVLGDLQFSPLVPPTVNEFDYSTFIYLIFSWIFGIYFLETILNHTLYHIYSAAMKSWVGHGLARTLSDFFGCFFFFFVVLGPTHWSTGISFMVCDLYSVCDLSHHSVSYVKVVSLMTSMLVKDHLHLGAPIYDMLIIYSDANQLL